MNKLSKVCGRTCLDEAMQCPACRSAEFVGHHSHIDAYKTAQQVKSSTAKLEKIEQQISDMSSFPIQLERPLFFIGIASFGLAMLLPRALSNLAAVISGFALAISLFLSRTNDTTKHLQAKAKAIRETAKKM
jgi:hypothetical protein